MRSVKKALLLPVAIIMAITAQAVISCSSSDDSSEPINNDGGSEIDISSSGGNGEAFCVVGDNCVEVTQSVCELLSGTAVPSCPVKNVSCMVSTICAEVPQTTCDLLGGTTIPFCPNATPESSSSATISKNTRCILSGICVEVEQTACGLLGGTPVSSCPNATPSSSSIGLSNNSGSNSSSSAALGNNKCIVNGNCLEIGQAACTTLGGTPVSSCPVSGGSSSSAGTVAISSSSYVFVPPTASTTGPVACYGKLKASGNRIRGSKTGTNAVQVRGVSLGWSNTGWESARFFDAATVNAMVDSWKAEIIRAPMGYAENGGYKTDPSNKTRIETVVNAAIAKGVYVIIDWHSHDADNETAAAKAFFTDMAQKYGSYDNVIFEIYNEPLQIPWSTIKGYATDIISAIRTHSDNLILVGTPNWDQHIDEVNSYTKINDPNVAYVLHFYAAEHFLGSLQDQANSALSAGVPIFVSEYGTVMADGDGMHSTANTNAWMTYLDNNKISSCAWNVNDKPESSAFFGTGTAFDKTSWTNTSKMTESGQYVYSKLNSYYANAPWRTCTFSNDPPGGGSGLYCDFGYPTTGHEAGCFEIDDASDCDIEYGKVATSCGRTDIIYCDWGIYLGPYDPNAPEGTTGGGCSRVDNEYACISDYGDIVSRCPATSL